MTNTPSASRPRPNRLVRMGVFALCGLALVETIAHFVFEHRPPTREQWRTIRSRVERLHEPGDLIVSAPDWSEPMAREVLGDSLMPISMIARADDDVFARVLEVDILGQRHAGFSAWPIVRREVVGKFELMLRRNPSWQRVYYDALEHVDPSSLSVSVTHPMGERACGFTESAPMTAGNLGGDPTAPRARFNCPGGSIHWVGITIIDDEQYRPRRCIWAASSALGAVVLRFRQVPFKGKLVGHAGAPWLMVRDGVGPAVSMTASTPLGPVGTVAAKDTDGWIRFEWSTQTLANSTSNLELRIAQTAREQRFCFTLEAR